MKRENTTVKELQNKIAHIRSETEKATRLNLSHMTNQQLLAFADNIHSMTGSYKYIESLISGFCIDCIDTIDNTDLLEEFINDL